MFGLRTADNLIGVGKGQAEKMGQEILDQNNKNIVNITARIGNHDVNITAQIFYKIHRKITHHLREYTNYT